MMIRYFCEVAPGGRGDLGYEYLVALAAKVKIRAIPIGPAAALGFEKRWWRAGNLFTIPLETPYVNVVCAPLGMPMGVRAPVHTMGTVDDLPSDLPPELRAVLVRGAKSAKVRDAGAGAIVYEPATVLEGMYTVGCKNVAILRIDGALLEKELAALCKYDLVICPTPADAVTLATAGVRAVHISPHRVDEIIAQLEHACGSAISATTLPSPASVAPPATTAPPSTPSKGSSSRSRSSGRRSTDSPAPKNDTPPSDSTSSPSPSAPSWARRMWRFITRHPGS